MLKEVLKGQDRRQVRSVGKAVILVYCCSDINYKWQVSCQLSNVLSLQFGAHAGDLLVRILLWKTTTHKKLMNRRHVIPSIIPPEPNLRVCMELYIEPYRTGFPILFSP